MRPQPPPFSDERLAQIRAEFARLQKRQFLVFLANIPALLALLWIAKKLSLPVEAWEIAIVLLFVGNTVFGYKYWRCPACGERFTTKFLGIRWERGLLVRTCRYCGVRLV